jgi:hypothetical protein
MKIASSSMGMKSPASYTFSVARNSTPAPYSATTRRRADQTISSPTWGASRFDSARSLLAYAMVVEPALVLTKDWLLIASVRVPSSSGRLLSTVTGAGGYARALTR